MSNESLVYVAGASAEIERSEAAIAHAAELGLRTTFDWCKLVRDTAASGRSDGDLTDVEARKISMRNLMGVTRSKCLIILRPMRFVTTRLLYGELSAAVLYSIPVVISAQATRQRLCMLEAHATVVAESDREAVLAARRIVAPSSTGGHRSGE